MSCTCLWTKAFPIHLNYLCHPPDLSALVCAVLFLLEPVEQERPDKCRAIKRMFIFDIIDPLYTFNFLVNPYNKVTGCLCLYVCTEGSR